MWMSSTFPMSMWWTQRKQHQSSLLWTPNGLEDSNNHKENTTLDSTRFNSIHSTTLFNLSSHTYLILISSFETSVNKFEYSLRLIMTTEKSSNTNVTYMLYVLYVQLLIPLHTTLFSLCFHYLCLSTLLKTVHQTFCDLEFCYKRAHKIWFSVIENSWVSEWVNQWTNK